VLYVNDDAARRYVLGRLLRDHGFAVIDASTGAEGLELDVGSVRRGRVRFP
jgi:CheY-like chemotaxis protein